MARLDLSGATLSLCCRPNRDGSIPRPKIIISPRGKRTRLDEAHAIFAGARFRTQRGGCDAITAALRDGSPVVLTCADLVIAAETYGALLNAAGVTSAAASWPNVRADRKAAP